jgi:hypothetical protein
VKIKTGRVCNRVGNDLICIINHHNIIIYYILYLLFPGLIEKEKRKRKKEKWKMSRVSSKSKTPR